MKEKKGKKKGCLIGLIVFVVLLGGCVALFGSDDSDQNSDTTSGKNSTEATTEAVTESTTHEATEETEEVTTEEATTEATTKAKKKTKKAKKKSYKRENWNPDITYDQLARNPDDYTGKEITFSGKVIQVIESSDGTETQLRVATSDDYDKVMYIAYSPSIVKSRILEDDEIRFYGYSMGLITYESTLGGNITIPSAYVEHITINN